MKPWVKPIIFSMLSLVGGMVYTLAATNYELNLPDEEEDYREHARPGSDKTLTAGEVFAYFQKSATVSAASKLQQTIFEIPASVANITGEDFLHYGFLTLNDAVWQQAGFFFSQGTERRTIGFRGIFEDWNNTHYLHLVDGIPFNDNSDGSAHTWEATPTIFIKNLEIVRGPGSALYGSNATNGVFSVTTYSGKDLNGSFDFRVRYGSLNSFRTEFLTGDSKPGFQYMIAYQKISTDGNNQKIFDDYLNSGRVDDNGNPYKVKVRDDRSGNYLAIKLQGDKEFENLVFQYHRQWWQFGTYDGWAYSVPNEAEEMQQNRDIISLSYQTPSGGSVRQEILTRYQAYHQNYHLHLVPVGGGGGVYPDGAREVLDFTTHDIFLRYQIGFYLPQRMDFLIGTENSLFYYNGDRIHLANFDPNHPDYLPFLNSRGHPDVAPGDENTTRTLSPFLEPVMRRPLWRNSLYSQWVSGELFSRYLQLTTGARYDRFASMYRNLENNQDTALQFQNISPRLGIVFLPTETFSFKLIGGQAFRDPAPIELFASNSWVAASNAEELKPETIRTAEAIAVWEFLPGWLWQQSLYFTRFENVISYNLGGTNLLENLYTTENAGSDIEIHYTSKNFRLSFAYSYAMLVQFDPISEDVSDTTNLNDAPAHSLRLGLSRQFRYVLVSALYAYQHQVRHSEPLEESSPYYGVGYKPAILPAFHELTVRAVYVATSNLETGLESRNLLGQNQYTAFNSNTPYIYRREPRTFWFYARMRL